MVKHTQTHYFCLSVFDRFVVLALDGLSQLENFHLPLDKGLEVSTYVTFLITL